MPGTSIANIKYENNDDTANAIEEALILNGQLVIVNDNVFYYGYHLYGFYVNLLETLDPFVGMF